MKSQFKKYAIVAAFSATLVFAQGTPTPAVPAAPATPAVAAPATPAVPAAAPATPAVAAPATPAVPEAPVAEAAAEAVPEVPDSTAVAAPEEQPAVPEPVQTVAEVAPVVAEVVAPVVVKEPLNIKFGLGFRLAAGISNFYDHNPFVIDGYVTPVGTSLSFGLGFVFCIELNNLVTVSPELQYTMYRANREFTVKTKTGEFNDLKEAGISLHALELPILARFNIKNIAYAEVGPQIGYNIKSVIYQNGLNHKLSEPELNAIAFGPALGGGVKLGGFLFGARGYFGILEYAKYTKGYPWTFQVSITQFLF
jgi:hypothetical protein